jgi:hypothetical protein
VAWQNVELEMLAQLKYLPQQTFAGIFSFLLNEEAIREGVLGLF